METLRKFLNTKPAKRALWTVLNSVMALGLALLVYLASENVTWAASVLPLFQALSQFLTKYLNTSK